MKKRYVLVGNFGVGNMGDEALREYFLRHFSMVEWCVLSAHPGETNEVPRLPCGMRSLFHPWWQTLRAYHRSDGVVFGGGSLFTDTESVYACILWWWHGWVARLMGKPVYLAYQGIGPFHTRLGAWCARSTCRSASFLSVRDRVSKARAASWNLSIKIVQSFDPVISLIKEKNRDNGVKNVLSVIPRNNSDNSLLSAFITLLEDAQYDEVRIVLLQPDDPREVAFAGLVRSAVPGAIVTSTVHARALHDLVVALSDASLVLTERYHGAVAAVALDIPVHICPQAEGDKLYAFDSLLKDGHTAAEFRLMVTEGERELSSTLLSS